MSNLKKKTKKKSNDKINKYNEVKLIKPLIELLYDYRGIAMQTKFFKNLHNDFYYISLNTFSDTCISIYKINFLKQIDNLFISDRLQLNYDSDDDDNAYYGQNKSIRCVECGEYHADCTYKNCNHSVNHMCAIRKVEYKNKCKECQSSICKNSLNLIVSDKEDTCSICLEKTNTKLKDCGHYFHRECIEKHNTFSNSCPMCRNDICKLAINKNTYKDIKYSIGNFREGTFNLNYINYIND